jgi:hypothetical protein
MDGIVLFTHKLGEVALPPAPIVNELEAVIEPKLKPAPLPLLSLAPFRTQPAVPPSNEPPGARK